MKHATRDVPIYAALFTEGAFQDWINHTAGDYLHHLIGNGAESQIIDAVMGLGHRLKAGHDISGLIEMIQQHGPDGAETWFRHMFADLMSPHGIPLPGAAHVYRFLKDTVGVDVSEKFFVDWTCVSATDLISAGVTLLLLARMHKLATGEQRIVRLGTLSVGQVLLLAFAETNPFFLVTIPLQTLLLRHEWKKWQLERLQERLDLSERVAKGAARLLEQAKA